MEIKNIIECLSKDAYWMNPQETRDIMLLGNLRQEVSRVGVCWVATNRVIDQAIEREITFLISHEYPFYHTATAPKRLALLSANQKMERLMAHNIALYRCHDAWDMMPEFGVADVWARRLGFAFTRKTSSYIQHAVIEEMTVRQLAKRVAAALTPDGENGVYVFGDPEKRVSRLGMGTGAATDIFKMLEEGPCDVCIVADDGISNYYQAQYALDNALPLIVVNHSCCEIAGIRSMADYLNTRLPELSVSYLEEGYTVTHILAETQ